MRDYIKPIKYKRLCVCHSGKESSDLGGLWFGHCLVRLCPLQDVQVYAVFEWKLHGVFTSFLFGDAATGVSKKKPRSATQRWWSLQRMALPKERRCQNRRSKKRSNLLILLPFGMLQFCRTTQDEIRWDIPPKNVGFMWGFSAYKTCRFWPAS